MPQRRRLGGEQRRAGLTCVGQGPAAGYLGLISRSLNPRGAQMLIKGIRSFSPDNANVIEFYRPLTIIVGQNGAGKTVRAVQLWGRQPPTTPPPTMCVHAAGPPCTRVEREAAAHRLPACRPHRPSSSASRWRAQGSCRPTRAPGRASSMTPRHAPSRLAGWRATGAAQRRTCGELACPPPTPRSCSCHVPPTPALAGALLQVAGETEVKAQIKLRFLTATRQPVVVIRSFQVRVPAQALRVRVLAPAASPAAAAAVSSCLACAA